MRATPDAGLRVAGAKGAAARLGVRAGDFVLALAGSALDPNISEADFAARVGAAPRPLTLKFRRAAAHPATPPRPTGAATTPKSPFDWAEEVERHPRPDFDLDSPVVAHLINEWTKDTRKAKYVALWLKVVADTAQIPATFPSNLTLVSLAPEVKHGFASLVVPILRARADVELDVRSRRARPRSEPRSRAASPSDPADVEERWDLQITLLRAPRPSATSGNAVAAAAARKANAHGAGGSATSPWESAKRMAGLVAKQLPAAASKPPAAAPAAAPDSEQRRRILEARLASLR